MAFDLTNLQILKANSISFSSFFEGLFLVTNFRLFLLKINLFLSCIKKDPSNVFSEILFFCL